MPLQMYAKKNPQILAVASGKGGVGKSTVAVNLALAFRDKGLTVGLIDADIYGPSVRKMLPEDRMPIQKENKIIPALCNGIRMISMAYFRKEQEAAIVRAPIANNLITQFLNQVEWGDIDLLIIDLPPGTGDIQLTLVQQTAVSGVLLVTTPQEISVMDVRKAAHMFHQVNVPIFGIVENMSFYGEEKLTLFGKGGGERLAGEIGVPLFEQLPIDPEASIRADQGISIFDDPKTILVPYFQRLVDKILFCLKHETPVKQINLKHDELVIEWADGGTSTVLLKEMQSKCPCAGCVGTKPQVNPNVAVKQVNQVGRYAIKIEFTSGCSNGLYSLDDLKRGVYNV